ncbi:hypothetical protein HDV01_007669 [Terramyces sp. JEL0728]|nr:hypothetical protein HDV01_007669 [Terramyces sp. JEL0728]
MYWCHSCEVRVINNKRETVGNINDEGTIKCLHCDSEFVEEMDHTEDYPGEFIPGNPTIVDFGGFISILTQGLRQAQAESEPMRDIPGPIPFGRDARANEVRDRMLESLLQQLQSLDTGFTHYQQHTGGTFEIISDYALGNTFDQILTRLMEMHEGENKPPAASDSTLDALPRIKFTPQEG